MKGLLVAGVSLIALAGRAAADDIMVTKAAPISSSAASAYDWSGFYAGGHLGYAWGSSNWTASTPAAPALSTSGSLDLFQPFDAFKDTGSFFEGLQAGYNYMLPNRVVVGAEADVSFPSFPNSAGISDRRHLAAFLCIDRRGELQRDRAVIRHGTGPHRLRSGKLAVLCDRRVRLDLRPIDANATGHAARSANRLFCGDWAGRPAPASRCRSRRIGPRGWNICSPTTASAASRSSAGAQRINSDFSLQELRVGLNYQFGNDATPASIVTKAPAAPDSDNVNFHGQTTFLEQAYPAFRSPYQGANSLPGGGEGRETWDATLYAGVRLWQGAELGSIRRSIRDLGSPIRSALQGFPAARPTKLDRLSLCAAATRVHPPDYRLGRRNAEGGRRRQSICRLADRQPAGHHCGQIRRHRRFR